MPGGAFYIELALGLRFVTFLLVQHRRRSCSWRSPRCSILLERIAPHSCSCSWLMHLCYFESTAQKTAIAPRLDRRPNITHDDPPQALLPVG
jgi:hypothetical protein